MTPAPFDYALIIVIREGFADLTLSPDEVRGESYIRLWDYVFTAPEDAKDLIDNYFKAKEWIVDVETTIQWTHAVVYAGYDTDLVPYPFGKRLTLGILPKELVY